MSSGGAGSGLYKSTDAGRTWTNLTKTAKGLPPGISGRLVSRCRRRNRAGSGRSSSTTRAACIAPTTAVHRQFINGERKLRQRAWYYTHIYADPRDTNMVYALNVGFFRSRDGGKTFPQTISVPHGDGHDLWIAPNDPQRMINANDGGANVSFNAGRSWSDQDFATAQFYHVATTNEFPYKICGAQQDNSTLCGPSRKEGGIRSGLVRRRRRRVGVRDAASDQARHLRRKLRRVDDAQGREDRLRAQHHGVAEQPDGLVVRGHPDPVPVDVPHRLLAALA